MADDPQNQPDKKGWIENLAARSTGLPSSTTPPPASPSDTSMWSLAGVGIQFAGTVLLMALLGWKLDGWMGWSPWGVVSLTFLGLVGGLYLLIKERGGNK
jgi:F0F1-type ATP synthase assembly protein I